MMQPAIAAAMGVSLSTMNRAHMAYGHGGIKALRPKRNGGRKHENMTLAEEKALLARFAKAAGAGEMLNIHPAAPARLAQANAASVSSQARLGGAECF
jgi:transposase